MVRMEMVVMVENKKASPKNTLHIHNNSGIALLIVISSIALLTLLMYAFRYEVSINKIKSINIQDKVQARLNAKSALMIGLARLTIFGEAYNKWQKDKNIQQILPMDTLNQLWNIPMLFPLPKSEKFSIIERSFIEKFEKNSLMQGEMQLSIMSLGNKFGLNFLGKNNVRKLVESYNPPNLAATVDEDATPTPTPTPSGTPIEEQLEKIMVDLLDKSLKKKRDSDENFYQKYSNKDVNYMVSAIRYYTSDKGTDIGENTNQLEGDFQKLEAPAKNAPMNSLSEMYLLPEWNDDLVDLIKNEISTVDSLMIDLNTITEGMVRFFFPEISDDQIKEYYKIKNDPKTTPVNFKTKDDFLKFLSERLKVNVDNGKQLMEQLESSGMRFSGSTNVYKIIATGIFGKSSYTLNALVMFPIRKETKAKPNNEGQVADPNGDGNQDPPADAEGGSGQKPPPPALELFDGIRILEIYQS